MKFNKLLIGLLLIVGLFLTPAAASKGNDTATALETANYYEVYSPIIQRYIQGIQEQWGPETYLSQAMSPVPFMNSVSLDNMYLLMKDIDQDGDPELMICQNHVYSPSVIDMYTIINGQLQQVTLVTDQETILQLTLDNRFIISGINNAGMYSYSNGSFQFNEGIVSNDGVNYFLTTNEADYLNANTGAMIKVGPSGLNDFSRTHPQLTVGYAKITDYRAPKADPPLPEGSVGIYRLYNSGTGEHLFTSQGSEVEGLSGAGWIYEGRAWAAPATSEGTIPVYRLFNPAANDHLYSTDGNEIAVLVQQQGWVLDNNGEPLFYSGGETPIFRLFDPQTGKHQLTVDEYEYNTLPAQGWAQEGVKLNAIGL